MRLMAWTADSTGSVPSWSLGDRLAKARKVADVTAQQLAADIGISRDSVRRYEADDFTPKAHVLMAWALRCGVPYVWLATGETPPNNPEGGVDLPDSSFPCMPTDAPIIPLLIAS
jgi:transcriptional regulator with XRE-family HTH domain